MDKGNRMATTKSKKKKIESVCEAEVKYDVTLTDWDMSDYIKTKKDVVAHLEAALEENDIPLLLSVIGDIARSKGMTKIARSLGMSREGLYRSLAPTGKPSFETVVKLLNLLGLRLSVEVKGQKRNSA